jgi:hypothetical protein
MKRFRDIIQDIKAPSTSDLWINNGELKYYTSNGSSDVYVLPGNLQTTEGWFTTDVESIVGNWDEFTKAVSGGKIIVGYFQNEGQFVKSTASVIENDGVTFLSFSFYQLLCVYIIDQSYITIVTIDNFLCASSVVDRLNSSGTELPLSANQGRILNDRVTELESKSNVAVLTPTGTKLMELVSSSPNVTQEQLVEAGFTPEICRRLNAGEVIYMSGECASFSNEALYPIQGITLNSSPDLVPPYLCYCYYSGYKGEGTASSGCFITIKENSPGKYLVDYIEV